MKHFKMLLLFSCTAFSTAWSQEIKSEQQNTEYIVHNRIVEKFTEDNKSGIRFSEGEGAGVAWVNNNFAILKKINLNRLSDPQR